MATDNRVSEDTLLAYATGRLDENEAGALERAASTDAALAAEIALARGLVAAGVGDADGSEPNEFGWARLSRAIEAERVAAPVSAGAKWPLAWQIAATAVFSVALWQAAVVPFLNARAENSPAYEMAGAAPTASFSARVTLVPTASERSIRETLLGARASIVAGPSALGVYTIAFKSTEDLDRGVLDLTANRQVIETIEPEG